VCGDLGGGGGNVVHLEVYALGEAQRHPIHAKPICSIHLILCAVVSQLDTSFY
jgi:hypothetical protein